MMALSTLGNSNAYGIWSHHLRMSTPSMQVLKTRHCSNLQTVGVHGRNCQGFVVIAQVQSGRPVQEVWQYTLLLKTKKIHRESMSLFQLLAFSERMTEAKPGSPLIKDCHLNTFQTLTQK